MTFMGRKLAFRRAASVGKSIHPIDPALGEITQHAGRRWGFGPTRAPRRGTNVVRMSMSFHAETRNRSTSMDYLRELIVFARVAEHQSFSSAARLLDMTPSAVSRSVSRLERHLGGRVLNRTTRAMSLTEFGSNVYATCARMAEAAWEVQTLAGQYEGSPRGRLRVTAPVAWGQARLAPRIAAFVAKWPEIAIELELSDRVADLVSENFDVALRLSRKLPAGMVARRIGTVQYLLVASSHCMPEVMEIVAPRDLARFGGMLWGEHDLGPLEFVRNDGACETVSVKPRVLMNNGVTMASSLENAPAIGLVADFAAAAGLACGRLKRLLPEWSLTGPYEAVPVHAVYAPVHHIAPKTRAFIDHFMGSEGSVSPGRPAAAATRYAAGALSVVGS
jgi:DNA-binding transcriptional LysR family regulator